MITDEELDDLPEDDEEAFVLFESIVRESMREITSARDYRGWDAEREYVAHIMAFADARSLILELPRNPPSADDNGEFWEWYQDFARAVDYYKVSARLRVSARRKQNIVSIALAPDFKAKIGAHLTAIRNIVKNADVADNKRDAIYKRIASLQEEVDRDRTRTEAVVGLWLAVTGAIGRGSKDLDPAIDRLERIMGILADAKEGNEMKALSAPKERKRLAPPTIPVPTTKSDWAPPDIDEELPF